MRPLAVLAVASFAWLSGVARVVAQDDPTATPAEQSPAPPPEVRAQFDVAMRAYNNGQFEAALDGFQRVYDATHNPEVLYDAAMTLDRLRRDADALAAYEEYLRLRPDADDVASVQARIRLLRTAIAAHQQAPPPLPQETPHDPGTGATPAQVPRDPGASAGPGPLPWILVGTGAAAVVTGGIFVGLSLSDKSTVESGTRWSDIHGAYDRVPTFSTVGFIALAVGGAMVVGGLTWAIVGASGENEVSVSALPSGVVVRGTF